MSDLQPAYIAVGSDSAKVNAVLKRMRRHFEEDAIETYMAVTSSGADIAAGAQMMGLLAAQRLAIVTGADAWKADDVSAIVEYLKAPSPDTVLLLTATKLAGNSRLKKAFAATRTIIECGGPEKPADVATWVLKRFADHGVEVPRTVATELVARAGHEHLDRLITDVEMLVIWANGDPITVDAVRKLTLPNIEHKIFKITDAWASRDKKTLLSMTEELLQQGEHPVPIAGFIARHLRYVHQARRALEHMSPSQAQAQLVANGANQWASRSYVEQAQRIGMAQADAALARAAQLQAELQGGSNLTGLISQNTNASAIVLQRGLAELV
ncbi:MAG: DNA polymerase III subunit delta [Thermoleophilia bacterium]|nr:DNA polymerase III subunit delta [Thermoleophilia bacterium]